MTETPREHTPPAQPAPVADTEYRAAQGMRVPQGMPTPQGMPMAYAEPDLAPGRLIFSEKTDRAIGFLARVSAIYLIIGLVLLVLVVVLMLTMGSSLMYGLGGGY